MERVQPGLKNPRANLDKRSEFGFLETRWLPYGLFCHPSRAEMANFKSSKNTWSSITWRRIQPRLKNWARIFSPGKSKQIPCNRKRISPPTPNLVPRAQVVSTQVEKPSWTCAVILFSRISPSDRNKISAWLVELKFQPEKTSKDPVSYRAR